MSSSAAAPFDPPQLIELKRVTQIAVAPSGDWAAVSVQRLDADKAKYVTDLWRVPLDGAPAAQLTRGEHGASTPCFRSDGALGFLSSRPPEGKDGDDARDRRQVWVLPAGGGEAAQLTDEPLGIDDFAFAESGDRLLCIAAVLSNVAHDKQREAMKDRQKCGPSALRYTRQPVRHWDHWLPDGINTPIPHLVEFRNDGSGRRDLTPDARREHLIEPGMAVSPDGRYAAITSAREGSDRIDDIALLLFDLTTGASRVLAEGAQTEVEHPCFAPDSRTLACIVTTRSREKVGKPQITLIDVETGAARPIGGGWDRWPALGCWTPDGRALIVSADDEGAAPVFRIDAATGAVARLSALEALGTHSDLHVTRDGGLIVGIRSTLRSPPELFTLNANAGAPQMPRDAARLSGFAHGESVIIEDFRVRSTDGATIQSWIVKPAGAKGCLPALFTIHGGPIGAFGDGWHWRWNALVWANAGYLVVLPNARGSTGFGQDFIQGIWCNQWGAQCYSDLMAVADAVEQRADVDPRRIGALGGSFGGYMTNWIGGNTSRFKALATHACVFSMSAFTGVTDHPAYWMLEMNGDPYSDIDAFDKFSPARFVRNWKSPTLIIHGERDYRCPIGEGLALFEALQHFGIESEIVVFPDENHWILKPRNILAWNAAMLDFFGKHLSAGSA